MHVRGAQRRVLLDGLREPGGRHGPPCLCGHDQCEPPTKFESKAAFAEIAPEGRFIGKYSRDW